MSTFRRLPQFSQPTEVLYLRQGPGCFQDQLCQRTPWGLLVRQLSDHQPQRGLCLGARQHSLWCRGELVHLEGLGLLPEVHQHEDPPCGEDLKSGGRCRPTRCVNSVVQNKKTRCVCISSLWSQWDTNTSWVLMFLATERENTPPEKVSDAAYQR